MDKLYFQKKQKIAEKIRKLLYEAELNAHICRTIQKFLEDNIDDLPYYHFLILTHNNSFFRAVSIVNTIISRNKQEINIQKLDIPPNKIYLLSNDFESVFKDIRDKIGDHRDIDLLESFEPCDHVWSLVKEKIIMNLYNLIIKTRNEIYDHECAQYKKGNFSSRPWEKNNPFTSAFNNLKEVIYCLENNKHVRH